MKREHARSRQKKRKRERVNSLGLSPACVRQSAAARAPARAGSQAPPPARAQHRRASAQAGAFGAHRTLKSHRSPRRVGRVPALCSVRARRRQNEKMNCERERKQNVVFGAPARTRVTLPPRASLTGLTQRAALSANSSSSIPSVSLKYRATKSVILVRCGWSGGPPLVW